RYRDGRLTADEKRRYMSALEHNPTPPDQEPSPGRVMPRKPSTNDQTLGAEPGRNDQANQDIAQDRRPAQTGRSAAGYDNRQPDRTNSNQPARSRTPAQGDTSQDTQEPSLSDSGARTNLPAQIDAYRE